MVWDLVALACSGGSTMILLLVDHQVQNYDFLSIINHNYEMCFCVMGRAFQLVHVHVWYGGSIVHDIVHVV